MGQPELAVATDRLPWLDDEPQPRRAKSKQQVMPWVVAAALLLGAALYWLVARNTENAPPVTAAAPPATTVPLPAPRASETAPPQVEPAPARQVEPVPAPAVALPQAVRQVRQRQSSGPAPANDAATTWVDETASTGVTTSDDQDAKDAAKDASADTKAAAPATAAKPKPLKLWPSRESKGASGRLVQIGAFGSRTQAKLGWRHMMKAYPAVGRLPAVVVASRNSRGRVFFRFQIGTTSQAHSEVLCQRMQSIRFSCAVVGLPWKAKVER